MSAGIDPSGSVADPIEELADLAARFTLFAALRRFDSPAAGGARLGETRRIQEDPVRIVQEPGMHFSAGEVAKVEPGRPARLHVESFGMFGCHGALPLHLTDFAARRIRQHDDRALVDLVAMLQHRMTTLFFRAWAAAEPTVDADPFRVGLGALMGLGLDELRGRDSVDDDAKFRFTGRFALATRCEEGLADVLSGYFRLPVAIQSFEPRWLDVPRGQRTALGVKAGGRLGVDAAAGRRSWQCQFSFRVVISGLSFRAFETFLPGARSLARLRDLVVLYAGREYRWTVELRLRREEAPALRLGSGARLGWSSWTGRPGDRQARVVIHDTTAFAWPSQAA